MAKLALVESDGDEDAGAMQSRDLHDSQVGQKLSRGLPAFLAVKGWK